MLTPVVLDNIRLCILYAFLAIKHNRKQTAHKAIQDVFLQASDITRSYTFAIKTALRHARLYTIAIKTAYCTKLIENL